MYGLNKKGDLVQLKGIWKNKVGLVTATAKHCGVIRGHIEACHCIVALNDVKLIKAQIIPKNLKKYLA